MRKLNSRIIKSTVLLFALLSAILTSTGQQIETGKIISVEKTVSEFQNISIDNNFEVYIFEGIGQKVIIETEEQLLNNVAANVFDNCLNIFCYNKVKKDIPVKIFITVNELYRLNIIGKANVKFFYKIEDLAIKMETESSKLNLEVKSTRLFLNISGQGHVEMKGNYEELGFTIHDEVSLKLDVITTRMTCNIFDMAEAKVSGMCNDLILNITDEANIESSEFIAKNCNLKINDSGEAYLSVSEKFDIIGEQNGFVEYRGNPLLSVEAPKSVKIKNKKEKVFVTNN